MDRSRGGENDSRGRKWRYRIDKPGKTILRGKCLALIYRDMIEKEAPRAN